MQFFALPLLLAISACGQDYNSNSSDESLGQPKQAASTCDNSATPLLCSAITIIDANCVSCHSRYKSYKTDEEWKASKEIVAGVASNSALIQSLQNAGGSMPKNESALSDNDYQTLVKWIDAISP